MTGRTFTVRAALDAGVSRQQMRHRSLLVPTRGLRAPRQAATLRDQAQALALVLPSPWAYSHTTAAELLGIPMPRCWEPGRPLEVMRPDDCSPVRRPGVRGHRGLDARTVLWVDSMPVTELVETWCDLGARLTVTDLVVAGDAALNRDGTSLDALAEAVALRKGHRGVVGLAAALPLLRIGSGSPMESRARLAFHEGGLPEPALNADILDAAGTWIARADFVWRQARVIVEYEGDRHRADRQRWLSDIARIQLLEDAGWRVIRITALDLSTPERTAAMVERVRRALVAGMR